jgi:hypothetical protein
VTHPYENLAHACDIEKFIGRYYNGRLLQSAVDHIPPEEFEQQPELPERASYFWDASNEPGASVH